MVVLPVDPPQVILLILRSAGREDGHFDVCTLSADVLELAVCVLSVEVGSVV